MNAESLRKVLDLEKRRGYADTAVFGGLDKFLHNWSAGAGESIANPHLLAKFQKLFKASYATMSTEQRTEWAKDVLGLLDELENRDKKPAAAAKSLPVKKKAPAPVKKTPQAVDGQGL